MFGNRESIDMAQLNVTYGTGKASSHAETEQAAAGQSGATEHSIRAAVAAAETVHRSVEALAQGHRQLLEQTEEQYETVGRRVTQAAQETASDLHSFMLPPETVIEGVRTMQESMAGFVSSIVQSQARATQALVRIADPTAIFDLQRRFIRDYLDTATQGYGTFIRLIRQATEQTLRPTEEQIEKHQQNGDQQRGAMKSDAPAAAVGNVARESGRQMANAAE
jgi:hypothetical protein